MKALAVLFMLLFSSASAEGQLVNGDFSHGSSGWTIEDGASEARFPEPGVNGTFRIGDYVAGDAASISQPFSCSADEGCTLALDYRESGYSEITNHSGTIRICVDEVALFQKPLVFDYKMNWTTYEVRVQPGQHLLRLRLGSVMGITAEIDNVRLSGTVPALPTTWGTIKARWGSRYR